MNINWFYLVIVVLFLVMLNVIGVVVGGRRTVTSEDFLVSGRKLTVPVLSALLIGTWASSYTVLASAESSYKFGISGALWYAIAVALPILFYVFPVNIAQQIRRRMPTGHTVVEFIGHRYDTKTRILSLFVTFGGTFIEVIAQILGLALVFNSFIGIPVNIGIYIIGFAFIVYVALGGSWSVAVTNYLNVIIIGISLLVAVITGLVVMGGVDGIASRLPETHFNFFQWGPADMINFLILLTALTLTDPVIWQPIFAGKDDRTVSRATVNMSLGWAPLALMGGLLGVMAAAYFGVDGLRVPSSAAPAFVATALPKWTGIVFLLGLTALIVSTASAYLNSTVSIAVVDIFIAFWRPDADDQTRLRFARLATVVIGLITMVLAQTAQSMLELLSLESLLKVSIAIPLIAGLYLGNDRLNAQGAFWGILSGLAVALLITYTKWNPVPILGTGLTATIVSGVLSAVVSFGMSRIGTPAVEKEMGA